ncbi:MAG TPA: hypothetical protein VI861_01675, partial [Rickettsiales bacterium]|nr:hypothetical protein [Rickettsiales bacterium]
KSRVKVTKERMEVIYKAMGAYILKNYAMPCPSPLNVAKTSSSFGVAGTAGTCGSDGTYAANISSNVVYGGVPVNSLGLANEYAEDGFGTKIAYIVSKNFTKVEYPTATDASGFSFYDDTGTDMIKIFFNPSAAVISNVMFALISMGENKYGGFNVNATARNSVSSETLELANHPDTIVDNLSPPADTADVGRNSSYTTYVTLTAENLVSSTFDDIILFKRRSDMVVDFNAYFLMGCDLGTGYGTAFQGKIVYRTTTCTSPNDDVTPAKQCSPFGDSTIDHIQCP